MKNHFILATGNITIGDHHGVVRVGGLTIYLDVVWATLIAAAIVFGLGLLMRRKVTSGVPGKLQLLWEVVVEQVSDLAASAIGPNGVPFVGLGVTVGLFILVCNWLAFVPSGDPGFLAPPTGDVNLPLALALIVFFCSTTTRSRPVGPAGTSSTTPSPTPRSPRSTSSKRSPSRSP